jgi:hypothetical protein
MSQAGNPAAQAVAASKVDKIEIASDGTVAGTTVTVNGKAVKNVSSAYFSFYNESYDKCVNFSYTTKEAKPADGGLVSQTSFRLVAPKSVASLTDPITIVQTDKPIEDPEQAKLRDTYRQM